MNEQIRKKNSNNHNTKIKNNLITIIQRCLTVARLGLEVEGFPVAIRLVGVDGVRLGVEVLGVIVLGAVKC